MNTIPVAPVIPDNTTGLTRDRFASAEYTDPQARLPRIQALRGEKGEVDCGYFITEAEMEKAGWYEVKAKDLVTYLMSTTAVAKRRGC